jgi:chromosome segregation ATPase
MALTDTEKLKATCETNKLAKEFTVGSLTQRLAGMRGDVERMEARRETEEKLFLHRIKLAVVEYRDIEAFKEDKVQKLDEANAAYTTASAKVAPFEAIERDLKKQQAGRDKKAEDAKQKLTAAENHIRRSRERVQECEVELDSISEDLDALEKNRQSDERALDKARTSLNEATTSLARLEADLPGIHDAIEKITKAKATNEEEKNRIEDMVQELQTQVEQTKINAAPLIRKLKGLEDHDQIFRKKLQSMGGLGGDRVKFMDWIAANARRFKQEVYGPACKHMKVKDPVCAMILESAISENKLFAFIAQNEDDAKVMKDARKQLGTRVDIFTMSNATEFPNAYPASSLARSNWSCG